MRLTLYSHFVTVLTLSCHFELTSLVHSVRLDEAGGVAFDAAAADDNNYSSCFVQSMAETDSQLQSRVESDSEFLGMLAGTLIP